MTRLKLDQDMIGISSIMEKITRVWVKDCFKNDDVIYFVVATGSLGKALGKKGSNIKKVQDILGKKVRVIEFRSNVIDFVKNVIYPTKVNQVIEEEGIVFIKDDDRRIKSQLIGRDGKNLELINRAVKRFFSVKEVKVI